MENNQLVLGDNEVGLDWKKVTNLGWVKAVLLQEQGCTLTVSQQHVMILYLIEIKE